MASLLNTGKLVLPPGLPDGDLLERERRTYQIKQHASGYVYTEAARERDHDDLVIAPVTQSATGRPSTGLSSTLSYRKLSGGVWGSELEAISTNKPDSGNVMRETAAGVYMFSLDARALGTGTFQVVIDLHNGGFISGQFSIK